MIQPSNYSPIQISFEITDDLSRLCLFLIFDNEIDAGPSNRELQFSNHVKMSINSHMYSKFKFEFKEDEGKTVILQNVVRDDRTFKAIKDKLGSVTSACLIFHRTKVGGKSELIYMSALGGASVPLISVIESFEIVF